jgi:TPR repeat protein
LIVLIVSTLAQSQQTVASSDVVNNTKSTLNKLGFTDDTLENLIDVIWVSLPFQTANNAIRSEQKGAIQQGLKSEKKGDHNANNPDKAHSFYKEAAQLYANVAAQGNKSAKYLLGALYARGLGLSAKEGSTAVSILRDVVAEGITLGHLREIAETNKNTAFVLVNIYSEGPVRNEQEAGYWLRVAAKQGHSQAQVDLANL